VRNRAHSMSTSRAVVIGIICMVTALAACSSSSKAKSSTTRKSSIDASATERTSTTRPRPTTSTTSANAASSNLPGMPPLLDPNDVYAADRPGALSPTVAAFPQRVYVPNSKSDTVDVIDPATFKIVDHFPVGGLPQHVVPSWDLRTLYVTNDTGNSLTPIDPATGKHGPMIPVEDPYNMYFTPDGKYAIVVAERLQRLDFRDAHTMRLVHTVHVDCAGVDHLDFTANGRYLVASCEFSAKLLKLDVAAQQVVGYLKLRPGSKPQDVKLDPAGKRFFVADMTAGGVYVIGADSFKDDGFVSTGAGAHGLYVSRDSKVLYVTNRSAGSISLFDFAANRVVSTWHIPGGSPDMGGVSADGKVLWVSGRYNAEVYAIDTTTGAVLARIRVGAGPHGLCVYPQPGRYSLGHTGVFR
jgi:YVTN family beta-propeller protein